MMEYLTKYNQLPLALRMSLAQPGVITAIKNLESKHRVNLALTVIKAAIGELNTDKLVTSLMTDLRINQETAISLAKDLRQSVFYVLPSFNPRGQTPVPVVTTQIKPQSQTTPVTTAPAPVIPTMPVTEIDLRVLDIIQKGKIDLSSQVLLTRFKQVLRTYLLGVRDRIAAKSALTRPFEMGGLSFGETVAEDILKLADGKLAESPQKLRPSLPDSVLEPQAKRDVEYNLVGALKDRGMGVKPSLDPLANKSRLATQTGVKPDQSQTVKNTLSKSLLPNNLPWGKEPEPVNPRTVKKAPLAMLHPLDNKVISEVSAKVRSVDHGSQAQPSVPESQTSSVAPAPVSAPIPSPVQPVIPAPAMPPVSPSVEVQPQSIPVKLPEKPELTPVPSYETTATDRFKKTESGKIKMDDVHFTPRVFTPIDELKYLTLKNFRNLSINALEAAQLVSRKIEALAREEYSWKLEGVQAFKQSPLNSLYVEIYHTAMSEGRQIAEIIQEKQRLSDESLTAQEFDALYQLNQAISLIKN